MSNVNWSELLLAVIVGQSERVGRGKKGWSQQGGADLRSWRLWSPMAQGVTILRSPTNLTTQWLLGASLAMASRPGELREARRSRMMASQCGIGLCCDDRHLKRQPPSPPWPHQPVVQSMLVTRLWGSLRRGTMGTSGNGSESLAPGATRWRGQRQDGSQHANCEARRL